MRSFTFTKSIWDAIESANLSDKDTLTLIRFIMRQAFGSDKEPLQLTRFTKPLGLLICEMIGADPEPVHAPAAETAKASAKAPAAAEEATDDTEEEE